MELNNQIVMGGVEKRALIQKLMGGYINIRLK
ncbi:hypothetical protein U947_02587 [Staphylococcus aureus 18754-2]|nr:hypothetical protein Newbould305_2072 [Staphylococcus aureus subsp. aureus str. Newbould 305]ENN62069.1 hypothetical protein U79_00745 [Staphylococcus aureus M1216]EWP71554.1 hypothetical protein Q211_02538 [Staphylococcus aureus M1217]EZV46357.1 hypothetical protein U947_02587 [Staphylococcus aureus 18754-2]EZW65355.1 hypothetical protein U973_02547 [Staphylococcus aureus 56864-11]SAO42995.1 Uncharacterised protein [Staphylococcus aureus]